MTKKFGKDPRPYKYAISVKTTVLQSCRREDKRPAGKVIAVSDTSFFIETEIEVLQVRAYAVRPDVKPDFMIVETANGDLHIRKDRLTVTKLGD